MTSLTDNCKVIKEKNHLAEIILSSTRERIQEKYNCVHVQISKYWTVKIDLGNC